jgi:papain like protease
MEQELIEDPSGVDRRLGDLGFMSPANAPFNVFGATGVGPDLVPRGKWKSRSFANKPSFAPTTIKNQGSTNECNAFAVCYAMEAVRRVNSARDIALSPGFIYGNINNGNDNGSRLEDGLTHAQKVGTVPATLVPELEWHRARWPDNVFDVAKSFRALEWWLCPDFETMASAVHHGFPVIFGIAWGRSDQVDDEGWLPDEPAGGIAGGHAMCALGLTKRSSGKKWGLLTVNSWGTKWGNEGWHVIPETRFARNMFGGGAWALRSVTLDDAEAAGIDITVGVVPSGEEDV